MVNVNKKEIKMNTKIAIVLLLSATVLTGCMTATATIIHPAPAQSVVTVERTIKEKPKTYSPEPRITASPGSTVIVNSTVTGNVNSPGATNSIQSPNVSRWEKRYGPPLTITGNNCTRWNRAIICNDYAIDNQGRHWVRSLNDDWIRIK